MSAINKYASARVIGISTSILLTLLLGSGCAHDELRQARYEATRANLKAADAAQQAADAERAAALSQKSAADANFARFEAEGQAEQARRDRAAAEARAKLLEESRLRTIERHYEYVPGTTSYSETYESYRSW